MEASSLLKRAEQGLKVSAAAAAAGCSGDSGRRDSDRDAAQNDPTTSKSEQPTTTKPLKSSHGMFSDDGDTESDDDGMFGDK